VILSKSATNEIVFKNGVRIATDDPLLEFYDKTPEFSSGCFETMLALDGIIPLIDYHFERLSKGIKYLGLEFPNGLTKSRLQHILTTNDGMSASQQVRVRLTICKDSSGGTDWFLLLKPISQFIDSVQLEVSSITRKVNSIAELSCKLSERKDYTDAFLSATKNGFDDALMLSDEGLVSETAIANIIWLKNHTLFTPTEKSIPLEGVGLKALREALEVRYQESNSTTGEERRVHDRIELISDEKRPVLDKIGMDFGKQSPVHDKIEIKYKDIPLSELIEADAVWIINSVKGPVKVTRIGYKGVKNDEIYGAQIASIYWDYVNSLVKMMKPISNVSSRNDLLKKLLSEREHGDVIFLDSQLKTHPSSQKSYLFGNFKAVITFESGVATIVDHEKGAVITIKSDPWHALECFRDNYPGYICGYFGYDLKNYRENLTSNNPDPVGLPEMWMGSPSSIYVLNESDLPPDLEDENTEASQVRIRYLTEQERYIKNVNRVKEYIREGDIYEVNLSHQIKAEYLGEALNLYESMRKRGPVPYGAYLKIGDSEICCASPERFLKKIGSKIISDPIKGTRPRGETPKEDQIIIEQLRSSEKDKAENLMIVDLVRNDMNRVCEPGSVEVDALFEIQSFGTVHQMVSRISGKLKSDVSEVESISACFPMGSMTGAPKIRAMEIIEKLEDYKRGLYSGAIGFFTPSGDFNFNVVIRSAIIQNESLYYSTGGAITSDSDAAMEWQETLIKMRALGVNLSKMTE